MSRKNIILIVTLLFIFILPSHAYAQRELQGPIFILAGLLITTGPLSLFLKFWLLKKKFNKIGDFKIIVIFGTVIFESAYCSSALVALTLSNLSLHLKIFNIILGFWLLCFTISFLLHLGIMKEKRKYFFLVNFKEVKEAALLSIIYPLLFTLLFSLTIGFLISTNTH